MTDDEGFMQCDTCRAKPGTPYLCSGCLSNRKAIDALKRKLAAVREKIMNRFPGSGMSESHVAECLALLDQ
jgi:hypothetical protein